MSPLNSASAVMFEVTTKPLLGMWATRSIKVARFVRISAMSARIAATSLLSVSTWASSLATRASMPSDVPPPPPARKAGGVPAV